MNVDKLVKSLEQLKYQVKVFDTQEEAKTYLVSSITNTTVGIGGSMTIKDMGLYDELVKTNKVYWHWESKDPNTYKNAAISDIYLSSVNGISENGEIINIDGTCNRISATLYGHKKVVFILGQNKIAENFEKAMDRARNIASVKNAIRLNKQTPCTKIGKCIDCKSPDRICRGVSVLLSKPSCSEYEVVIIKEDLGY